MSESLTLGRRGVSMDTGKPSQLKVICKEKNDPGSIRDSINRARLVASFQNERVVPLLTDIFGPKQVTYLKPLVLKTDPQTQKIKLYRNIILERKACEILNTRLNLPKSKIVIFTNRKILTPLTDEQEGYLMSLSLDQISKLNPGIYFLAVDGIGQPTLGDLSPSIPNNLNLIVNTLTSYLEDSFKMWTGKVFRGDISTQNRQISDNMYFKMGSLLEKVEFSNTKDSQSVLDITNTRIRLPNGKVVATLQKTVSTLKNQIKNAHGYGSLAVRCVGHGDPHIRNIFPNTNSDNKPSYLVIDPEYHENMTIEWDLVKLVCSTLIYFTEYDLFSLKKVQDEHINEHFIEFHWTFKEPYQLFIENLKKLFGIYMKKVSDFTWSEYRYQTNFQSLIATELLRPVLEPHDRQKDKKIQQNALSYASLANQIFYNFESFFNFDEQKH